MRGANFNSAVALFSIFKCDNRLIVHVTYIILQFSTHVSESNMKRQTLEREKMGRNG